jgi:hypothetical protein
VWLLLASRRTLKPQPSRVDVFLKTGVVRLGMQEVDAKLLFVRIDPHESRFFQKKLTGNDGVKKNWCAPLLRHRMTAARPPA